MCPRSSPIPLPPATGRGLCIRGPSRSPVRVAAAPPARATVGQLSVRTPPVGQNQTPPPPRTATRHPSPPPPFPHPHHHTAATPIKRVGHRPTPSPHPLHALSFTPEHTPLLPPSPVTPPPLPGSGKRPPHRFWRDNTIASVASW
jgi:hypothetical protein